jgi:hypothetical protein
MTSESLRRTPQILLARRSIVRIVTVAAFLVTLTAAPDRGYSFAGWGGACAVSPAVRTDSNAF